MNVKDHTGNQFLFPMRLLFFFKILPIVLYEVLCPNIWTKFSQFIVQVARRYI